VDVAIFFEHCERIFTAVEDGLDASGLDTDIERSDRVLTITLPNASKVIISANEPVRELWLAARSGGFHFRLGEAGWIDTRSGEPLMQAISRCVREQSGESIAFQNT
jgi:CyaY protein